MAGKQLSDKNPTGTYLGQSASDLIGFHAATGATSQRTSAAMSATHSVFVTTGLSLAANNSVSVVVDLLVSVIQEMRSVIVGYGLHKGGA
jgi:hypothetical protein